jgi:hypothetical protein
MTYVKAPTVSVFKRPSYKCLNVSAGILKKVLL